MPHHPQKPERAPHRETYPTGKKMKKGSKLDCLACKGKNPNCRGCGGTGKIVV
jgi:hypothetical protein